MSGGTQGPPTPANYSALLTANLDLLASPTREGLYCAQSHLSPCAHQQFGCFEYLRVYVRVIPAKPLLWKTQICLCPLTSCPADWVL